MAHESTVGDYEIHSRVIDPGLGTKVIEYFLMFGGEVVRGRTFLTKALAEAAAEQMTKGREAKAAVSDLTGITRKPGVY